MASVSFYHRGQVQDKESKIYVKLKDKDLELRLSIPDLACKPSEWKDGKCKSPSKKMLSTDSETINVRLSKLQSKILERYKEEAPEINVKEWLQGVLEGKQRQKTEAKITDEVLHYFDYYLEVKGSQLSAGTIRDIKKKRNKIQQYTEWRNKSNRNFKALRFADIDDNFRANFEIFFAEQNYKASYCLNTIKTLKTIARFAEKNDVNVNKHGLTWKIERSKVTKDDPDEIYLTFDDLKKIKEKEMPHEHLDNVRDWLLISCYTGQRISDFLRFSSTMVKSDSEGQRFIEFVQKKTNAKMRIPILKEVEEILNKRNAEFPRKISDVRYNEYVKKVCEIAEINETVYNGKIQTLKDENKKSIRRKVYDEYSKWELVSGHIGRRSFATNFYGIIPTPYLLNITGHSSERQFLDYIKKTDDEKAKSTANVFKNLGY